MWWYRSGSHALLFAHIGPGPFERFYEDDEDGGHRGFHWFKEAYNSRFLNIVQEFSDVVVGQVRNKK